LKNKIIGLAYFEDLWFFSKRKNEKSNF